MRISFKFLIWSWVVLFLGLGLMFYGAYNKLEPKAFIALLNEEATRNYPGSKLSVGEVDYRFSMDFNLNLKNIVLTRSGKTLTSISEVELKVPWWLILFDRGSAQINISDLSIFVDENTPDNSDVSVPASPSKKIGNKDVNLLLPGYLVGAHYTIRAKNIHVKSMDSSRRYFTLNKFLVREFQYGRNSAFELNLPIDIHHKDSHYTSELWLFGDVTPTLAQWALQFRGEFKTREASDKFQLEDLVIDGKASFNPREMDILSNINLLIDREQIGTGRINAKDEDLKIHMEFNKLPINYLSLIGEEIKNPHRIKTEGSAQGIVDFSRGFSNGGSANLSGSLTFDGSFGLGSHFVLPGKWKITFVNAKWETSFISPKGEVSFFHRAFLDFKKGIVTQYSQELGFEGLDYKYVTIPVMAMEIFQNLPDQTYFSSEISFKKTPHQDKMIDGNFRYGISPDKKYYQVDIHDSVSQLKLDFQNRAGSSQFSMEAKKFQWQPYLLFLDPYFNLSEGSLDGKVQGNWKGEWSSGIWLSNMVFSTTKNVSGEVGRLYNEVLNVFELDPATITDIKANASVSKNVIKLSPFILGTTDPGVITGFLSHLPKTKSALTLSYPKKRTWKPVTKEIQNTFWRKEQL
jgi:hypothetical protein